MDRRTILRDLALAVATAGVAQVGLTTAALAQRVGASEVKVAVAANFADPVKAIAPLFETASGHKLVFSFGATGQFYAQITQGAPFEVLLSADQATPAKAVAEGRAVGGTQFTYAIGRLVLYSRTAGLVEGETTLSAGKFAKIALGNPRVSPYGAAGVEVMKALGVFDALKRKLVLGNTIAHTLQFVDTGNAELGFVALSQVIHAHDGSRWLVPGNLHAPIAQDAVLLEPGTHNAAARAFLAFLKGPQARTVIETYGYGVGG